MQSCRVWALKAVLTFRSSFTWNWNVFCRCIEAKVDKYIYSVCPFKEAVQKDGGAHTRLGSWGGWESDRTVMSFTNGQGCWQGPNRSIRVRALACLLCVLCS